MRCVVGDLIEAIKLTYQTARYYGSSQNMTTLMVKISNQMIKACRAWIRVVAPEYKPKDENTKNHFIYDRHPKDILRKISDAILLNADYQKAYRDVRSKLHQTPQEKQFDFSEEAVFGNFDLFCKRLKKIADIIITKDNFSSLEKTTVPGLGAIIAAQNTAVNELRVKPYDPLLHRMAMFDEDYQNYKAKIKK